MPGGVVLPDPTWAIEPSLTLAGKCASCGSLPRMTAAKRSIPTASEISLKAASFSRSAGRCTKQVTFDDTRITSVDWASYPILRFPNLPDSVEVHVINRLGEPFLGTGEAAQGPTAAALANALADATGVRFRELPFTRIRVKAALGL